jgi:LPPG:FO 2-phospho-L-lactate transferase
MADRLLPVIDVEVSAEAVGRHYGARASGGLLDGWLVDLVDEAAVERLEEAGLRTQAVPLYMRDREATSALAKATLDYAAELRAPR